MQGNLLGDDESYPEILSDVAEVVAESLRKSGTPKEQAANIGFEAAELLREHLGGHYLYVPKAVTFSCNRRDVQIFSESNGRNVSELADKYQLTEIRIYQIIRRMMSLHRKKIQPDLFGGNDEH